MSFVELLQCVLCCEEEDVYEYRQAQRDLGYGGPLLDLIRSASALLPTHHRRERESRSEASESLLWNTHEPPTRKFTPPSSSSSPCHVVVHNPMSRDPIRPKNEPNLTRTVDGLTRSSQVTSPFKAVASASPKPSPSVSKPSTATSSDPFVSPAKPAAVSAHLNQCVSKSSGCSNEPSLSRFPHPSLSKTSSPTPQVQQRSSPIPQPHKLVQRPVFSDTKPPPISALLNQNVAKPPRPSDEPSSSRVQSPSSSKTTSPAPKAQERSAKQYKPVLRAVSPVSPHQQKETVYVQKDTSPIYSIPEDIEDLIERDIVPGVLQKPLSPSTYRDYFAALLYAEDVYIEVTMMHDNSMFLFLLCKSMCNVSATCDIDTLVRKIEILFSILPILYGRS